MSTKVDLIPVEQIEQSIFLIRGQRVMLSMDLAKLYGVQPKALIQAVKRNIKRFPEDFIFELSLQEVRLLRSQFVTLKRGRGQHPKHAPYAFTQEGVAMLSSVLNSERAIEVNIAIMRAFVKLRELMATHKDLARKIENLERKYVEHDEHFQKVFEAIRQLMAPPPSKRGRIGF